MKAFVLTLLAVALVAPGAAQIQRAESGSKLNNDPEVVYLTEGEENGDIVFVTTRSTSLYRDKKARSSMRTIKKGSRVKLVAMTSEAYRVKGGGKYNGYVGWVNPAHLASTDPDFVAKLKAFYTREQEVKALIANNEVAIGMTQGEVSESLGEPTKRTAKVTKDGETSSWEFITYEEQKHYVTVQEPLTGALYRRYSHTTREETGKVAIDFEEGFVTSIETSEQNDEAGKIKIVSQPIVFAW